MRLDQKIIVHCTNTDKEAEAVILRIQKGSIDVSISNAIIKLHHKKPGFYIGNMHGLEFTTSIKI